jgi:sugar (pentulose or hexulose) kinase
VSALTTSESAAVGAAILAGMGTGIFPRPEDAFEKIQVRTSYEPRKNSVLDYEKRYGEFKALLEGFGRRKAEATGSSHRRR